MRHLMRRWLPSPQQVRGGRGLRWLAPFMARPWLWRIDRRGVALGVATGVFFGFLVPIAQIPLSAAFVFLLRANLPAAVLSTLVSNPFTYAPIFIAAHRLGQALLDGGAGEVDAGQLEHAGLLATLAEYGAPLFAGLAVFAVAGALLSWTLVQAAWLAGNAWRARRLARVREQRAEARRKD